MRLLKRLVPSPAMIVALLALFVATSGGAYAMATLGAKTVGTKQLKNGAVTTAKLHDNAVNSTKVADGSLYAKDFAPGQLQSSLNGVAAGHTQSGAWAVGGGASGSGVTFWSSVSFPIPLNATIDAAHIVITTSTTATCPGTGRAARGYLCLYQSYINGVDANGVHVVNPTSNLGAFSADSRGFAVAVNSLAANPGVAAFGTWAVTG